MKKSLLFLLCVLLLASPSWAAITAVGSLGNCAVTTSGTTCVITTTADLEGNNEAVILIGADNFNTTDADHSEVASIADQASNTYSKLCEFTNGQGTADLGATVSLWKTRATTQLNSGQTITITFANTITRKAARAFEFSATNPLQLVGSCQTEVGDGGAADPGNMTISGLSSTETLFIRANAKENNAPDAEWTLTTNYSATGYVIADGGTTTTSIKVAGEYRIVTATGDSSDPSDTGDNDNVSVYVALREVAATATSPQVIVVD